MSSETEVLPREDLGERISASRPLAVVVGFSTWFATRVGLALLTYCTSILVAPQIHPATKPETAGRQVALSLVRWADWDGANYIGIAAHGYTPMGTAFFPLYPLLIRGTARAVSALLGPLSAWLAADPWPLSALLVSNAAALVGLVAIAELVLQEAGDRSRLTLTMLAVTAYPVAFYLANAYTESTFLAAAALTLLFSRRGSWVAAGCAAGLGALARPTGLLLMLPLVWEYGRQHEWWSPATWRRPWRGAQLSSRLKQVAAAGAMALAAPAGTATYLLYLRYRFGDPFVFVAAERKGWSHRLAPPWETVQLFVSRLGHPPPGFGGMTWQLLMLLDAGMLLSFLVVTVTLARRLPASFTLYSGTLILVCCLTVATSWPNPIVGTARYLLPDVPVFLGVAWLGSRRPGMAVGIIATGFLLQACLAVFWLTGGFVE